MANTNQGTSNETKSIVTVLLLIFIYPIGVILAWFWTRWPVWVKIVVGLPVVIIIVAVIWSIVLAVCCSPNSSKSTLSPAVTVSPSP